MPTNGAIALEEIEDLRWFAGLNGEETRAAASAMTARRLDAGEVLFKQGQPGDSAYLLVEGRMEVAICVPGQKNRCVALLEAKTILGEIGLMLGGLRTATATARSAARLCEVSKDAFDAALKSDEPWAHRLLLAIARVLARRVSSTDQQLISLIEEIHGGDAPSHGSHVAELERLRHRLFTQWSF